jgi:hypothetical protein
MRTEGGLMPNWLKFVTVLTALLPLTPAASAPAKSSGNLDNLAGLAMLNGTCSKLVVAGHDESEACVGKLSNTIYRTGRTGFVFVAGDTAVVTFSGMDTPVKGDVGSVRLDHVIFGLMGTGTDPNSLTATGSCRYTNPYAGPSHVDCTASTKIGRFSASFVSDGEGPDMQRF